MAKKGSSSAGVWAFTIGLVLALLAGFVPSSWAGMVAAVLVLLGIIVGFLNVDESETKGFLMASVSIMIALFTAGSAIQSNIATLGMVGQYLWDVMASINVFVFPATIVVALKTLYGLARN